MWKYKPKDVTGLLWQEVGRGALGPPHDGVLAFLRGAAGDSSSSGLNTKKLRSNREHLRIRAAIGGADEVGSIWGGRKINTNRSLCQISLVKEMILA